jgi:hypothetical protein
LLKKSDPPAEPQRPKMSVTPPTFEVLFGIPPHHRLWLVRSRGRGGPMWGEYWTHEEVNQGGTVLARYESYDEVDARGQVRGGWRTYDASGCLIAQHTIPDSGSARSGQPPRLAA